MSISSEYARRRQIAERIAEQFPRASVEAVHPNGPIGVAYLVDRVGYATSADARRAAMYADDALALPPGA